MPSRMKSHPSWKAHLECHFLHYIFCDLSCRPMFSLSQTPQKLGFLPLRRYFPCSACYVVVSWHYPWLDSKSPESRDQSYLYISYRLSRGCPTWMLNKNVLIWRESWPTPATRPSANFRVQNTMEPCIPRCAYPQTYTEHLETWGHLVAWQILSLPGCLSFWRGSSDSWSAASYMGHSPEWAITAANG